MFALEAIGQVERVEVRGDSARKATAYRWVA